MNFTLNYTLEFATTKHQGQTRKMTNKPYINHPIDTSKKVYEAFTKSKAPVDFFDREYQTNLEPLLEAALLHDTLEDTQTTYKELLDEFGPRVANLVAELTSNEAIIKKIGKKHYLKTKMITMSEDALLIKLCDRLSNISDEPREKYLEDTKELISHILEKRNSISSVSELLCRQILYVAENKTSELVKEI